MKFTLSWLKDHLDTARRCGGDRGDRCTNIGLEVEAIEDKGLRLPPSRWRA